MNASTHSTCANPALDMARPWQMARPANRPLGRRLGAWLAALHWWLIMNRSRRELADMDERMLKDIGITRAEANRHAQAPFWHV